MTGRRTAAAFEKTRLDRDTWPELEKALFEVAASGTGEHLTVQPFFFGTAFEEPPLMTYSVVSEASGVSPVLSVVKPSRTLLGTVG